MNASATLRSRIKEKRSIKNITLKEIAELLDVKEATVQRYESGEIKTIPYESVVLMAELFETSPSYLMGWGTDNHSLIPNNIFPIETKKIPLLGNIACGEALLADECFECYVEVGTNIQADFCLKAKGDSMINARIFDGDIVFVKKQSDVEDGEIAVVYMDGEATLKRIRKYGDRLQLIAENPTIPIKTIEKDDFETVSILGKAIAFQSDVK